MRGKTYTVAEFRTLVGSGQAAEYESVFDGNWYLLVRRGGEWLYQEGCASAKSLLRTIDRGYLPYERENDLLIEEDPHGLGG